MTDIEQKIYTHACLVAEYTYPNLDPNTPAYKKLVKAIIDFVSGFFNPPIQSVSTPTEQQDEISVLLYKKNWVTLIGCIDNSIKNIKESRGEIERAYFNIRYAAPGSQAVLSQIDLAVVELSDMQTIIYNTITK